MLKKWLSFWHNRRKKTGISCCIPTPELDESDKIDLSKIQASKCESCGGVGKLRELKSLCRLVDLKEGQYGRVAAVRGNHKVIRRLLDMGITPGTPISLLKTAPLGGAVEIAVRGSNLALSNNVSANVFVEVGE